MAAVGQRLARRLTAGSAAALDFELYADGAPARGLAGASGTASIRRTTTPPPAAELPVLPVTLAAATATGTLTLSADQTQALSPPAGESVNRIEITVKIVTTDGEIHFHGPGARELWGKF